MAQFLTAFTLALRNVLRQRRRSFVAGAAVAFGVLALILAGAFIEWIFYATREGTIQSGLGHIHVSRQVAGVGRDAKALLPASSPALATLRSAPGVRTVAPRLAFSGLASLGDTTISFLGEGVDPAAESNFGKDSILVAGQLLASDDPEGIIVGQGLAANLGAKVGDTIVLLSSMPGGGVNAVEGRVRGLFATVSKAYDDSALRVPLPLATRLVKSDGAQKWVVVLDDTSRTTEQLPRLATLLGPGFKLVPWMELADFYNKTVALLSRQMGVMHLIIGVIIVLTISNSMMMGVLERTTEIGTALALGTRRRSVLLQFVLEGLVLGCVGGVIGVVVGTLLAWIISAIGIPMPPPPGQARGFVAEMIVTVPLVAKAFALAAITALAAAFYPAWKASRIPIVDALRYGR